VIHIADQIISAIRHHGQCTSAQILERVPYAKSSIIRTLSDLKRQCVVNVTVRAKPKFQGREFIYELTGKPRAITRHQDGDRTPYLDQVRIETIAQAQEFAERLYRAHPYGYSSFRVKPDVSRCDLRRDAVGAASSLV
jgi:hypothetical protein